MEPINIAIDGPAGAGKSTIAKAIAKELDIIYLDTGAMYRAVALKALLDGVDSGNVEKLSLLVSNIDINIIYLEGEQRILLDNKDVTTQIRTPKMSLEASKVAVIPSVRIKMVEIQRQIAIKNNVVMDGRDIGTYVLPNADYKFFLIAEVKERAKRRFNEQIEKGILDVTFEEVLEDIIARDKNDTEREFAPLSKALDAIEIDTTNMSQIDVVNTILSIIRK